MGSGHNQKTGRRRPSRAQERERALSVAAAVDVSAGCDVCVVGGGAAGLAAAATAAEAGAHVVVLEAEAECGRTILATGNGRCNLANVDLAPAHYNNPAFVAEAMGDDPFETISGFFGECGLAFCEEDGRVYPLSRVAASVRNVLVGRCEAAGVTLAPARRVDAIARHGRRFLVRYGEVFSGDDARTISAASVIICVGGRAVSVTTEMGIPSIATRPVLCPLACETSPLASLDGRRAHAGLRLLRGTREIACERGEVMLRGYGLTGIVVFDLSRHARPGDVIVCDLVPTISEADLAARLDAVSPRYAGEDGRHALDGFVDPAIGAAVVAAVSGNGNAPTPGALAHAAKHVEFVVRGPADVEHAQVMRGGLSTAAFDPRTLEAREVPGLLACGEALDVDGPCGGYNLAWAWTSGIVAGRTAAGRTSPRQP